MGGQRNQPTVHGGHLEEQLGSALDLTLPILN